MIYTWNILSGYQSIMGSFIFHIPMLITMLLFIRIPSDDVEKAFPGEAHLVTFWYYFTLFNHASIGLLNMIELLTEWDIGWLNIVLSIASTVGRLSSLGNLCLMLHLIGTSEIKG